MIDMLVLRCPIQKNIVVDATNPDCIPYVDLSRPRLNLSELHIPLYAALELDGTPCDLEHRWEKIPSSYSNMAFKVFDFRDSAKDGIQDFFIELKASPAKLMYGHNLFGTDDLWQCAQALVHLFIETYPHAAEFLDYRYWTVEQVDITYFSRCKTEREAVQFINALQNVSNGQTRSRTGYSGTAYFGKANSRIKKIKVYAKHSEVLAQIEKDEKKGKRKLSISRFYTPELMEWSKGMVRWESSIKTRWFERRRIDNNLFELCKVFDAKKFWRESTLDLFKALEGKEMRIIKDDDIEKRLRDKFFTVNPRTGNITYGKANSAYRVYRSIKSEGWIESKRTCSNGTFHNAIEMLHECGLSKALLQNLHGDGLKCEVIPFIRYIEIDFKEQYPPFIDLREVA